MAVTPQRGPGMLLPAPFPVYNRITGQMATQYAGPVSLAAGQVELVPAGQWNVQLGAYTFLQVRDPITGTWRTLGTQPHDVKSVLSDGQNVRLANLTGCAVGAFITNVGSGYTSAPTVTASAGGSVWRAIVGGAINSTITITTAGAGFTYAPQLLIDAPPAGGVQATATCTVSGGAINAVTVVNQGAGYTSAPAVTIIPDPRDTAAITTTPVLTTALTGSGTVTAIVCLDHGTPQTSVITFTISGGGGASAAATAVMCFTLTGYTVGTAGAVYGNAQPILSIFAGGIVPGTAGAVVNPALGPGLFTPRQGLITSTSTAGGALTTGGVIQDGGLFQAVPGSFTLAGNSVPTTQAVATPTVGGVTDTSYLYPA